MRYRYVVLRYYIERTFMSIIKQRGLQTGAVNIVERNLIDKKPEHLVVRGNGVIARVATTLPANTQTLIKFNDSANCKVFDTHNAFDFVNSKFVAPVSGYYDVIGKVGTASAGYSRAQICKNDITGYRLGSDTSANMSIVNDIVYLNAGVSVSLYGICTTANTTYANSAVYFTVSLKK